jgi:hypothetical protein
MLKMIKKLKLAALFLSVTSMGYANGDSNNNYSSSYQGIECCTPCQPSCCGTAFIGAELLYWRAYESGLDNCIPTQVSDEISSGGTVVSRLKGKGRDLHFNWDLGFRLAAGNEFACSNWGVAAIWTHFHSDAHNSRGHENHQRWKINLDVLDAIAIYNYELGCSFSLRPYLGVRAAEIRQSLSFHSHENSQSSNFNSDNESFTSRSSDDHFGVKSHNKENFCGVGPLMGLEGDWKIGCGFSLYANAAVSWLYGNFHLKFKDSEKFRYTHNYCEITKHLNAVQTVADAGLGVRWVKCLCDNKELIFQLGLEHHSYFDFNRMGDRGDLSFDGLNFLVGLNF